MLHRLFLTPLYGRSAAAPLRRFLHTFAYAVHRRLLGVSPPTAGRFPLFTLALRRVFTTHTT